MVFNQNCSSMNLRTVNNTQGKTASHSTMSQLLGLGDNKQEMVKKANKKKSLVSQIVKFFISTHL